VEITLTRDLDDGRSTLGVLLVGGIRYQTIERPWRDNQSGISCVPPGRYRLERHNSEAHPRTWALVNPDLHVVHWEDSAHPDWRSLVLIHVANYARELRGCIAPGLSRATFEDTWQLVSSRRAMQAIQAAVSWTNEHTLLIT